MYINTAISSTNMFYADANKQVKPNNELQRKFSVQEKGSSDAMTIPELVKSFYELCKEFPNVNFRLSGGRNGSEDILKGKTYDVGNIKSMLGINMEIDVSAIIEMNRSEESAIELRAVIKDGINRWDSWKDVGPNEEGFDLSHTVLDISWDEGCFKPEPGHGPDTGVWNDNAGNESRDDLVDRLIAQIEQSQMELQDQYMQMVAESLARRDKLNSEQELLQNGK